MRALGAPPGQHELGLPFALVCEKQRSFGPTSEPQLAPGGNGRFIFQK